MVGNNFLKNGTLVSHGYAGLHSSGHLQNHFSGYLSLVAPRIWQSKLMDGLSHSMDAG